MSLGVRSRCQGWGHPLTLEVGEVSGSVKWSWEVWGVGEAIEKSTEAVVTGYTWSNPRRGGWKAVFKSCISHSGFGSFILFITVLMNWIELKELEGSVCVWWESWIDFNKITPFLIQKRQEGGVVRDRRHQCGATAALWEGSVPCPEQWARRQAWQITGSKATAINHWTWRAEEQAGAVRRESDSVLCFCSLAWGVQGNGQIYARRCDESRFGYLETEASH